MALIKCKECGVEVSSKAETCPNCGARVKAKPMGCGTFIGVVFLGGIVISIFSNIFSSDTGSGTLSPTTSPSSKPSTPLALTPAPIRPGAQWFYSQGDDAMGKGTINSAWVPSSNTVNFDFPYSGTQHATLMLRTHPRHGKEVIFYIEKGQIICHTYENCTVLVRFDDESPSYYTATGAADNSTETIFIQNYNKFIGKILTSKQVRISANIYQQGAPVFEFDVSNFDQEKYNKK